MKEEMKELYIEGVATHDDPESCVGARKGAGEALTGARAGRDIEPRNHNFRGADAASRSGRPHRQQRHPKLLADPARSETPCMHGTSMRENREIPRSPVRLIAGRAAQRRPRPHA